MEKIRGKFDYTSNAEKSTASNLLSVKNKKRKDEEKTLAKLAHRNTYRIFNP